MSELEFLVKLCNSTVKIEPSELNSILATET